MSAFTVVRFRAKPDRAQEFEDLFKVIERKMPGLQRFVLIKSGERNFCSIAEWDTFDHIVRARETMRGNLDRMRPLLEEFSEELGVTDPMSGEAVLDMALAR